MFQGPKGYIAKICEVHLQNGNSTTKWPFYTFLVNSPLLYNLFSLVLASNITITCLFYCFCSNFFYCSTPS